MSSDMDLSGKVAFITGATRGLGLAIAESFAAKGASLVIVSRRQENCEAVARRLQDEYQIETLSLPCNVSDWGACTSAVETALEHFGQIDILVNNAGMSPLYSSLGEVSEALFDKVIAVNLRAPFRISALVGEAMQRGNGGSIINISSVAAVQPTGNEVVYGAAKAGLNALSQSLVRAFGPTVRVNTIMPGPFLTDISNSWDMEAFEKIASRTIALKRGGQPEEIVGAALYLASSAGSYTNGAVIRVDGGYAWAAS